MKTGYKEMIRDRTPKVIDYALKWCKAKTRWVEHVYENFVRIYADKPQRNRAVKIVLGIRKNRPVYFDFHKTIMWDQFGITAQEVEYWKWVEDWINWFRYMYGYMEHSYKTSKSLGSTDEELKTELINTYLKKVNPNDKEKLAKFLVRCFEGHILFNIWVYFPTF